METKEINTVAFKVGDRVRFRWGLDFATGTIVEDRGNLGYGRRRLWRVEAPIDLMNKIVIELTESDLEWVAAAKPPRPVRRKRRVVRMRKPTPRVV